MLHGTLARRTPCGPEVNEHGLSVVVDINFVFGIKSLDTSDRCVHVSKTHACDYTELDFLELTLEWFNKLIEFLYFVTVGGGYTFFNKQNNFIQDFV